MKGDNRNIPIRKDIFMKRETKGRKSDVYISDDPWAIMDI